MATVTLDYPRLLSKNRPAVIRTAEEHQQRLEEVNRLFAKPSLTKPEKEYCELLIVLVEDYEKRHFSLKAGASSVEVLRALMEANQLQQKDLLPIFKHKGLLSEILRGKRPLSVDHIRALASRFRISADAFI
jgi:HTH-type transcriptional regulator/antitoxin HigA